MRNFIVVILMTMGIAAHAQNQSVEFVERTVRVKFLENHGLNLASNQNLTTSQASLSLGNSQMDRINNRYSAQQIRRVFPYAGKFEEKHRKYGLHLWYDITVRENISVENLLKAYGQLDVVNMAEPVTVYNSGADGEMQAVNDPRFGEQWHYENTGQTGGLSGADISLLEAWQVETGDNRVVVSVHDSGIDIYHPDLVNMLWTNDGEIPNDNLDNDNNGFVDDYYGYNFAAEVVGGDPSSVYDYHGHGTHTSGTIAAQNNNGVGVSGVAGGTGSNDGVRIMMMRLGDDYGSNSIFNPAPSFVYAADMGAVISSNSWGGGGYNQSIYDAIQYFVAEAKSPALNGGLVVMSSGNSSSSYPDYRSDIDGVMMVSATNHMDRLAWYSNYGDWVDISAPGGETNVYEQGVLSTLPGSNYGFFQGTSMACPHVTGVAGLLVSKAYGTGLTRQQLSEALINSADPIDELNPAYAGQLGSGRVNAAAALNEVSTGGGSSGEILFDPVVLDMEIPSGESRSETFTITNTSEFDVTVSIQEPEVDWIQIDAGSISLSSGNSIKLPISLLSNSEMGLHQSEVVLTHPSLSGLVTNRLPVSVYTLGEPELVSTDTLQFYDVYPGQEVFQDVTISNSGTDYITLESVSITNSYFGIDFEPITIAPESQVALPVSFNPETSGQKIDSLVFQTDQEGDLAIYKVVLTGLSKSTTPPSLVLSQDTLDLVLDNLGSGEMNVTLTNDGEDELIYSLERYPNEFYNPDSQQEGEVDYLGRFRKSVDLPVDNILDLAWDGNYLWMLQDETGFMFQFDLENEVVLDTLISEATSPRSITSDGEYIYEHDNWNNQIFKYSLSDTSVTVFENLTAFMDDGIAVDHRGIWGISYGEIILIDKESGEELSRSYSSYSRNSRSLIAVAGRFVCLTSSYLVSVRNSSYGYLDRYSYLAGYNVDQYMGLAFDGSGGWSYHEEAGKLVYFDVYRDFTNTDTYQRILMGGESVELIFWYDLYDHDRGLTYQDQWKIVSNDIDEPEKLITINAHVQDEIDLSVTQFNSSINTSTGYQYLDTLVIYNNSFTAAPLTGPVTVSDDRIVIGEHAQIVESFSELKVPYSMELSEPAEFQATFSITSYEPTPLIEMVASVKVQYPPAISIDTESISMSIYEHELDSVGIAITNSGLGSLFYDIINEPSADTHVLGQSEVYTDLYPLVDKSDTVDLHMTGELFYQSEAYESELSIENTELPVLSELLENLNLNYASINSLIPNRYDFYDGETGYRISDGGGDMYDSGNRLNTDLGGPIYYTGGSLSTSYYLDDAEYFTAKYPGLFVMAADVSRVSDFYISGGLGADGYGSVDGAELSVRIGGGEYVGFVKRVYNTSDPSVNHLIIVKNNGQVNHSFYADTNDDYHIVNNLDGVDQLYYLLFAGQSGAYIDNTQMLDIMQAFLDVADIESLEVPANETMEAQIYFDGQQLDTGFYKYDVEIISNDPENPTIAIPTELQVLSSPVLRTFVDTLQFGDHMVGTERFKSLEYRNEGSDTLIVSSHISSNPDLFQVYNFPDTIAPGAYGYIPITFRPDAVGGFKETILISSNDRLHPELEIPVSGAGLPSAIISYNPYQLYDTLAMGASGSLDFEIVNKGSEPTSYRLVVEEAVSYGAIDSLIERQRIASGVYDKQIIVEQVTLPSGETLASHVLQPEEVAGSIQSVGGKNVLVLGTGYSSNILQEVAEDLEDTEQFNYIVFVDTRYTIDMDLDALKYFDAILFFSWDQTHGLPEEYGDLLADYADAGGGVVMALEEPLENGLEGRWVNDPLYSVFNNSDINMIMPYDEIGLGEVHLPAHALMNGVNTFSGGYYSHRTDATADDLQEGVELVASWSDGSPLIMAKETDNFKLVQLGFNPVSGDYSWGMWDSSTDGMTIISNALNYVAGGLKGTEVDWVTLSSYESESLEPGSPQNITMDYSSVLEEEGWQAARITAFGGDSRQAFPSAYFEVFVDATSDLVAMDTLDFGQATVGTALSRSFSLLNQGNGRAEYVITGDTLGLITSGLYDTLSIGSNAARNHQLSLLAQEVGEVYEKVTVYNLTDVQDAIEVVLRAEIMSPGIIRITPDYVDLEVAYQGETNGTFMLHNDGEAALDFEFSAFHLQGLSKPITLVTRMENEKLPSKRETDSRTGGPALEGIGKDSFGYIFADSEEEEGPAYIWNDIADTGELLSLTDDGMRRLELPFEFPLYGIMKNEIYISANGLLSFDEKAGNPINAQLPSGSAPNGIIAAFWKDLNPGMGGQIHYVMNDDQLIVQYSEVPDYEESGVFTFQIKILSSGDIFLYYKEMTGKVNDATVGIEDLTGSKGLQVAFNTDYITDGLAVEILHPELRILPAFSSGSIAAGDSLEVPFLYHPLDDLGGYHMDQLLVASNDTINPTSQVFIHSWVEGPANIAAEKDTLLMDTTYIDQYDFARNFYRNDNVGVLKIDSIKSSSDQFAVMMPRYQVLIDEDGLHANLEYENITRYLNGEITGIVDPLEIKLVTRNQEGARVVQDIDFYTPNDSVISINTTIEWGLSIDWGFAQEEMYLEVFTEQQLSGAISERFVPVQDWVYHNSTSGNVRVLYRPTRAETETAQIIAYSNAVESTEMSFTAIGTGKSSTASISINLKELKEHLAVNDSSEQSFEISNVGTDSLYLSLKKKRFEFESNYQPIVVEDLDGTILSSITGTMELRAPQNNTSKNVNSTAGARILEEPTYNGLFYGTLSSGYNTYLGYGELNSPEEFINEGFLPSDPFFLGADYLYGSSTELLLLGYDGELYVYDLVSHSSSRVATLNAGSGTAWTGLATDPVTGELYGSTLFDIYKIDRWSFETTLVGSTGYDLVIGLAINKDSEMYAYTLDDEFLSVDKSTGEGTYVGDIGFDASYGQDMAYDPSNDAIFMASYSEIERGQLRMVNEHTGATEVIGQLATNMANDQVSSIAFPMVGSSYGLTLNVRDTVLAPGQSLEVIAGFNSRGMMNGTFRSEVTITSNDFSHPKVEIPVELLVSGNDPAVGDYDKIINFGMTTLYDTLSAEWTVRNDGMEVLILNLEELGNGFVLQDSTQDSVRIDIGSSKRIGFYFIPEEAGTYEFKSKWRTNDPNNELIAVTLSGAGQRSETHLEMDQMQLVFEGVRGETIDQAINFYSKGSDTVVYDFRLGDETVSWISMERDSTSLAPDSTRQSMIQVNTTDLEVGTYESYLILMSNDPYYDSLTLPVELEVINQDLIVEQAFELQVLAIEEDTLRYDLSTFFSDPDLDELTYSVSANAGLAGFELTESNLAIWGETAGEEQIVVQANDGNGSEAEVQLPLLLNDRPIVSAALENQIVTLGNDFVTAFGVMDHFEDVDALSVEIEATAMAAIEVSDDLMVSIKGLQAGQVDLMVTVSDGNHEVSQMLNLTINSPVVVDRSFEQQLLAINEDTLRLDMTSFFSDADADDLTYEVTQLNAHSGFEQEGTQLIIWGESTGEAQVTVHAADGKGGAGEVAIPLMINHRPVVSNPFASYYLTIGDSFQPSLMLGDYFEDVDGQDLTVAIDSSDFAHFVISENMQLLIKGLQVGNDTVTVTVSDGYHEVSQALSLVINKELLKLYPNPAIDFFTVNFPIEIDDTIEFRLLDMGGKLLKSWMVNPSDENSVKLDVAGVNSGLYFLEIYEGEERLSQERIMIK